MCCIPQCSMLDPKHKGSSHTELDCLGSRSTKRSGAACGGHPKGPDADRQGWCKDF